MVLVHKPGLAEHDFDHLPGVSFPIAPLVPFIEMHERIAGMIAPSKVVAIALNTSLFPSDEEARCTDRGHPGGDGPADGRRHPVRGGRALDGRA